MRSDDVSTRPSTASTAVAPESRAGLGPWSFYFLTKLELFWRGLLDFHALENLTLAAFLLVPLKLPWARRLRNLLAIPIAIALLYHDSWLPPPGRVLSQLKLLSSFRASYFVELLGRFVSWQTVAMLVVGWVAWHLVSRYLRLGFIAVALWPRSRPCAS